MTQALKEVESHDYLRGCDDTRKVLEHDMNVERRIWQNRIHILLGVLDGKLTVDEQGMEKIRSWAK